jgi:hypothetical protein
MKHLCIILAASWVVSGQTQVDLRKQVKNVDFSAAASTIPVKTGTFLPASCQTGEMYFKTNEPAGANLFGCTSANTWTNLSGAGGQGGSPAPFCAEQGTENAYSCTLSPPISSYQTGQIVQFQASTTNTGPATVNFNALGQRAVKKHGDQELHARDIKAGQIVTLVYDGVSFQMQSQAANYLQAGGSGAVTFNRNVFPWTIDVETSLVCLVTANCAPTGAFDLSNSAMTRPSRMSASEPATCLEGESYYNTTTHRRRNCTAPNSWSDEAAHQAGPQFSSGFGWYAPLGTGSAYGAILASTPLYFQLVIPYPMSVSALVAKSNSAAGAGLAVAAALYDANGSRVNGAHGNVVAPPAGDIVISFAMPITLPAGVYYLGIASEDDTVAVLTSEVAASMLNVNGAARVATGTEAATGAGASFALPASIGTMSAVNAGVPSVYLIR